VYHTQAQRLLDKVRTMNCKPRIWICDGYTNVQINNLFQQLDLSMSKDHWLEYEIMFTRQCIPLTPLHHDFIILLYPLYKFISFGHFSTSHHAFLAWVISHREPSIMFKLWSDVMSQEIKALKVNQTEDLKPLLPKESSWLQMSAWVEIQRRWDN